MCKMHDLFNTESEDLELEQDMTRAETNIQYSPKNSKYSNGYLVFEYSVSCIIPV
jgi:hypothetical protein